MIQLPIAIFVDRFIPGGTQRQLIELLQRIDRRRFRVHPVCFHDDGPWTRARRRIWGIRSRVFRFTDSVGPTPPASSRDLRGGAARTASRCCIHGRSTPTSSGFRARRWRGVPLRIGSRRGLGGPPAVRRLQTLACRFAHRMVANSRAAANQLIAQGVAGDRIDIIANGIDLSLFPQHLKSARPRKITMVACLREEKRIDVLIAAAPRILARYPDAEFQIVGDGPCRAAADGSGDSLGVQPQVRFMGHRDDVPAILSASDLFVLPSESEASPNVILEAMAAGLAVVASRVGGIPELVTDGVSGSLVPPGDPDALADALLDLLDHPSRGAAFGRAGRARIEREYSFERMVTQFETLYLSGSVGSVSADIRNSSGHDQCRA